jgi:hypothetical protein
MTLKHNYLEPNGSQDKNSNHISGKSRFSFFFFNSIVVRACNLKVRTIVVIIIMENRTIFILLWSLGKLKS